ncbi:MAG: ABC transporter permease [Lachnospiraceae bacterium]|nr:ABC transporter permease [Lachnospiraceae bacterium]
MQKVKNRKVINNLAISGIKSNPKKYAVLVAAVVLTTLLFSSLFTVGGSLIKEIQLGTMRQVGGNAHAGFKYLSQPEYELVKNDKKLKEISYRTLVGFAEGEAFKKVSAEVYFSEPLEAKFGFCYPEKGRMPEAENEIVTSDIVLNKLGVPCEIGAEFPLTIRIGEESVTENFVLCGYFTGDPISMSQMILVSKDFQEKYAPTRMIPYTESGNVNDISGYMSVDFNFSNSINIQKKVQALIERTGIRENVDCGVNWAYMTQSIDPFMVAVCVALLITFFAAGYLIIYNIFDINIVSDMQEYGLLKTVGTSGKQLKKIVMRRANIISLIGIPAGLLLGVGVGALLLPSISNQMNTVTVGKGEVHLNIWILLGAAVFSYLTVIISAQRPCRKASKVSPIETLRYSGESNETGKSKKKLFIVILSLSLALVVLNSVISFVSSFTMDEYIKSLVISDFSIQDATLDNFSMPDHVTDGIGQDVIEELKALPGVNEVGNIYVNTTFQEFTDESWQKIEDNFLTDPLVHSKLEYQLEEMKHWDPYTPEDYSIDDLLNELREEKTLEGKTYGMSEYAVSKLNVASTIDGSDTIDWEKFNSGDYVLVNRWTDDDVSFVNFVEPGDKVLVRSYDPKYGEEMEAEYEGHKYTYISYDNAPVKEYTVYAVVDLPLAIMYRVFSTYNCYFILPEDEYLAVNGDCGAMRTILDVDDDKEAEVEEWLKNYTTTVNTDLDYDSKETVKGEYASFNDMLRMVGIVLAGILGLIGLMNFANTMVTSIIVRSRELAMLEAVGMTGAQQRHKLMKEGLVYFLWTAVVSVVISSIMSLTVIRFLSDEFEMFVWRFNLLPLAVCLPFILALIIIIPVIAYNRLSKRSVTDRLRVE